MKKLRRIIILTITLFTVSTAVVSAQNVLKKSKSEIIHINKKGEIHDHGWNKIGYIGKDDIIRDNKGETIYFIDKNGNVIDAAGKNLRKAQKNGNYFNLAGENIITVKDKDAENMFNTGS